jgi:hypothetical protein
MERAVMTVTGHPSGTTTAVSAWLAEFGDALAAGDPAGAAALFSSECYWRDLVAFTWNIKTMEGRGAVAEMLEAVLPGVTPSGWRITSGEEPAEAGGLMELTYWGNSLAAGAEYDQAAGRWTVRVERDGQPVVLRPAHLVMAADVSGRPNVPSFRGMAVFRGDQHHSSVHPAEGPPGRPPDAGLRAFGGAPPQLTGRGGVAS